MRHRISSGFIALLILSLVLLAGCGTSGVGGQGAEEFRFAMSGLYKPFNYKKDGQLVGFDVEIGMELARRMGMKGVPVTNPWETILEGLKSRKYDAIVGSMAITEKRKEQVSFSDPYYRSGAQIFVAKGNTAVTGKGDLSGKKIGVVKASTFKDIAVTLTAPEKVIGYDSDVIALQDLATGRVDAVITDQIVGVIAMKENNVAIQEVGTPLFVDEMAIPVRKDDTELLNRINDALATMIKDGTYARISEKWFGRSILGK